MHSAYRHDVIILVIYFKRDKNVLRLVNRYAFEQLWRITIKIFIIFLLFYTYVYFI